MDRTSSLGPRNGGTSPSAAWWTALLDTITRLLRRQSPPAAASLRVDSSETAPNAPAGFPHAELIEAVLRRYATLLEIPLSFRTGANGYSRPAKGDAVHIHAFALPTPPVLFGAWQRVPLVLLPFAHGIPLSDAANRALALGVQLGRGRPLLDRDARAVGETLGTNLYCLFDLPRQEAAWIPVLLRRHLDLGLPHLLPALPARKDVQANRLEDRLRLLREETEALIRARQVTLRREARETYVRACQERVAEEIRFLQAEIAFLEDGVEEMARRIAADTRRLTEGRRRLRLLYGERDPAESSGRELESLQALPGVREARIQDGRISLTTAPILVEYEGRRYRLGCFHLDLHFNGDVRILNLTDRIGLYDHPHVQEGRPCLGTVREGVAKLLGEFQFVAATEVLIDFLRTVNPADWRLPVLHWPEAGHEAGRGVLAAT